MMTRTLRLAPMLALLATACAAEGVTDFDEIELGEEVDAKTDGASPELRVRASDTTLWVRTHLGREDRGGTDTFVLRGRTSRNLSDGRGFIFDDVYGTYAPIGARSFELSWTVGESRSLLHGVNQFIGLSFVPGSAGRADHMTARVIVRPRLTGYAGSGLYLVYSVRAVVSGGRVVYRVRGHANEPISSLDVSADGVDIPDLRIDGRDFEVDLLEDHLLALASRAGVLSFRATLASGAEVEKQASMILAVSTLGFTSADAYDTWPPASCTASVRSCIESIPAGSTDLGACGDAVNVLACGGMTSSVTVDDVAFQAALLLLDTRLRTAEVRADANGLVGSERAEQWLEAVHMTAEGGLEQQFGRVYPDVAARDAALAATVEAAVDIAYATPLELVEPLSRIPGDATRARQVAADALLAHLAEQDFLTTELGRPLIELARVYRARHVESIRSFRENLSPEPGLTPGSDVYIGEWIGLYTEVELDRATQAPVRILVEID